MQDQPSADQETAALKLPPHSLEAEQSVLGGLMLDNQAWDNVSERLVADDFYRYEHRLVFNVMIHLAESGQPLDVVTLSEALEARDQLDTVGGLGFLAELARNTPSASNIRAYADIVRERATLRKLIRAANQIAEGAFSPQGRPADELLNEAERLVFQIAEERPKTGGPIGMSDLLTKAVDRIDELFNLKGEMTGLSTGFRDLDEMTSGLQPSDLVIIAGRPSMGKTTFAMNQARWPRFTIHCGKLATKSSPNGIGPCQPPRKSSVIIAHISTMLRYSPIMNSRYGVEEYST